VISLVSLPRMTRSPLPAWFEYYLLLDSGSRSYQALVLLQHTYNHPVMRVAAWILEDVPAERTVSTSSLLRLRVRNRLHLWLFLLRNPQLANYRTGILDELTNDAKLAAVQDDGHPKSPKLEKKERMLATTLRRKHMRNAPMPLLRSFKVTRVSSEEQAIELGNLVTSCSDQPNQDLKGGQSPTVHTRSVV